MRRPSRRLLAGGFVSTLLAVSLVAGVGAPAQAASFPGYDLWQQMLNIKSSQLQAANGAKAQAAWSHQAARNAATNAGLFTTQEVFGNVAREAVAEVIPLDQPKDYAPGSGGKIKPGKGAKGPRIPRFPAAQFMKGPLGLGTAVTAYMFRGDLADGAMQLVGMNAENAVCTNDVAKGGFVNFLTGQDCNAWQAAQDFVPNIDIIERPPGWADNTYAAGRNHHPDGSPYFSCQFSQSIPSGASSATLICGVVSGRSSQGLSSDFTASCINVTGPPNPGTVRGSVNPSTYVGQSYIDPVITINCGAGRKLNSFYGTYSGDGATVNNVRWYADHHALWVPGVEENPLRTWECTVKGSDGNTYVGESVPFRESTSGRPIDEFPQPSCPTLPPNVQADSIDIKQNGGGRSETVYKQDAMQEAKDWDNEFGALCATQSCLLDLVLIEDQLSCFGKEDSCDGWMTDKDRDTKYECRYGNKKQHISECYAYATIFNTKERLAGNPWADPETGQPIKGGVTARSIDSAIMGAAPRAADGTRDCFGGGWSVANPLEWVLKPLQCAAEWAFVPRPSMVLGTQATTVKSWDNTVFGQIGTVTAPLSNIPVWTGCSGVPIDMQFSWPKPWAIDWQFGAACSGPLNVAANVTRTVAGGLVAGGGILALSSYLGWGIGFRGFGRQL